MNEMLSGCQIQRFLPPPKNFRPGSGNSKVWERFALFGEVTTEQVHRLGADMTRVNNCKQAMKQYGYTLPKGGIRITENNYRFPLIPLEG